MVIQPAPPRASEAPRVGVIVANDNKREFVVETLRCVFAQPSLSMSSSSTTAALTVLQI